MRIHFQEKPYDLLLVGFLTGGALGALASEGPIRVVLGLILVLFVPGYVLSAAIFPSRGGLDLVERAALSVGLSIAVVPLLGLMLNFTSWGIRLVPMLGGLTIFVAGVGAAAYARRVRLPVRQRLGLDLEMAWPAWGQYSSLDRLLVVALVASLVGAAAVVAYAAIVPRPGEQFTEFYLLNAEAKAENYPTNLSVGANATLLVGIVNHEGRPVDYAVVASLEEYRLGANSTGAPVRSLVGSSHVRDFALSLENGRKGEFNLVISTSRPGLFRLELQLFLVGTTTPYRELHLWLEVHG